MLLGIEALYFSLVAFRNITDYSTHYAFLKNVMSMDTTFRAPDRKWRAVESAVLYHVAHADIIARQAASAAVCWAGTRLAALRLAADILGRVVQQPSS